MNLSSLKPPKGALSKRRRVGRGPGSGWGKTAARGHKGQKSRSGGKVPAGFEGGQMPLHRRIPKRGFTNIFAQQWSIVNLDELNKRFEDGDVVDPDTLADKGIIWSRMERPGENKDKVRQMHPVKVLARGTLTKKLTIKAHKFSRAASEAIVAAGGVAEVI